MMRFTLFIPVLTLVACSDPRPVAPHPAGKANCALCGFLGDEDHTIAEGQGAHESPEPDSLSILFADSNLEGVVRQALDRPQGRLRPEDIASLTRISASGKAIHSLAGLEHFIALQKLDLNTNEIADITPLAALTEVDSLELTDNQIVDVTPLTGLTRLAWLELANNLIEDAAPLVANTGLEEGDRVNLENNPLSAQARSDQIPALQARGVEVQYTIADEQDIDTSSNSTSILFVDSNLERVMRRVLGRPRGSLTPGDVASLIALPAANNNIRSLVGIEHLTALQWLYLYDNRIVDISPLKQLTNLEELYLHDNQIVYISLLKQLTNLNTLWLDRNQIADISPLKQLTNLNTLWLDHNQIIDITSLKQLTNLNTLWLNNNRIEDLTPLIANTGLGEGDQVYLANNPLSAQARDQQIPTLQARGVDVRY